MPVTVSWDDETQSIIRWDYGGDWTWADTTEAAEITRQLLDAAANPPVAAILLNLEGMQTIPRDSLRNMRTLFHVLRPDDIIVLCGDSVAVNVMIAFLRSIYRSTADQLLTAPTLADGRRLAFERLNGYSPDSPTQPTRPSSSSLP